MRTFLAVAALALAPAAADPALAQERAGESSLDQQLRKMAERIEALEKDNASLRQEVADLRSESGQEWLTEQRATEIRALVQDVLADADARASLQSSGMTAGWDNGFFLASPDGRFRLQIDGLIQVRWNFNAREKQTPFDPTDRYRYGFENTRTQLTFRGHVFGPDVTYLVRGGFSRGGGNVLATDPNDNNVVLGEDAGGEFKLLDAWIRFRLNENWWIRLGQFKLPFNREELIWAGYQQVIERSQVNESLNVGRSQGIELEYGGDFLRWRLAYSDGGTDNLLGVGQLVGTFPPNTEWSVEDAEFALTSRLEWLFAGQWRQFDQFTSPPGDPFGLMAGVAVHYQQNEHGTNSNSVDWLNATADISAAFGGANLYASATYSYTDGNFGIFDIFGLVVQGGFYIAPKWELFARYEYGFIDSKNDVIRPPDLSILTAGVNWYIDGQDIKFSFDFGFNFEDTANFWAFDITGWRSDAPDTSPQFVVRTQFQLVF